MRYVSLLSARRWSIVVVLVAVISGLGLMLRALASAEEPAKSQPLAQANALSQAFRDAADKILPTVVMIKTTTKPQQNDEGSPRRGQRGRNPFKGTPFEDFFDDRDAPQFRTPPFVQQGVGSGVIIDPSGIILTNAHVVEGADEVLVQLADGRQFKASDIKTDDQTDLAVLRIKANEKLPAAKLGDSSKMAIGDWVLAVGNPFELEHTVSAGIVSGTKRTLPSGKRADYIQTDAAINPGNSGGPLVNLNGEVIGIDTAIASSSGGYQGVGFAIPSNLAKWVTSQLIEHGSVSRAYLGVGITEITNDLAGKLGVGPHQGVLVSEVFPDTPAAKAGFEAGDVITAFAGEKVGSPHELQQRVERSAFDSTQQVSVLRDKKPLTLQVEVKALPQKFGVARTTPKGVERHDDTSRSNEELGIEVSDLTPDLAEQLGLKGVSGAVITDVDPNGLGAQKGLREGMVIMRVGKTTVKNAEEFVAAMKNESVKNGVLLLVRTSGGNRFVVIQQP
jgi:serine protease Do